MTDRIHDTGATGRIRRPIRVLIRDEDRELVQAQGVRWGGFAPEGTDGAEGQVYVLTVPHAGDTPDDVEGQGARANWIRADDDSEGQGGRAYLRPATEDEVEGHGIRGGWLVPDDTDPSGARWRIEPDDSEGQGGRYSGLAPNEAEDTTGEGASFGRLAPMGDDTEGQGRGTRPPVD